MPASYHGFDQNFGPPAALVNATDLPRPKCQYANTGKSCSSLNFGVMTGISTSADGFGVVRTKPSSLGTSSGSRAFGPLRYSTIGSNGFSKTNDWLTSRD